MVKIPPVAALFCASCRTIAGLVVETCNCKIPLMLIERGSIVRDPTGRIIEVTPITTLGKR